MKAIALCCIVILAVVSATALGRETESTRNIPVKLHHDIGYSALIDPETAMYTSAAVDTYNIIWYDFEGLDWQGWTRVDETAQINTWFHADDFNGLGGGSAGRLVAIEGSQSAWCGARPTDTPYEYMCSWLSAPGYGNNWNQCLETGEINFSGTIYLSYHGVFDTEPGYDFTYVEYDAGGGNWNSLQSWDGIVDTIVTHEIRIAKNKTKLRFNFVSDVGWSDQDGKWPTDGACIIDSITIADESTPDPIIDFEDFEDWILGATENTGDMWAASISEPYGLYSGLVVGLEDKDPCGDNNGTQVIFFEGSPYPSSSYPGLFDTPFCKGSGNISAPCQNEMIVSPIIDMTKYSSNNDEMQDADIPLADRPLLGGTVFQMTHYRDLPLANLVFYYWHVRSIDPITSCPGRWLDYGAVFYGPDKDYIVDVEVDISELISGDDPIQIAAGVVDLCDVWYGQYGDCAAHTPAPWFDNIRLRRYKTTGPQWNQIGWSSFQDNFPEVEYDLDSWIRADMAININPFEAPINPGDSMTIVCTAKMAGSLRNGGVTGGAEVYMHVRATDIGPFGKPALYGPELQGTYGTYVSDDGEWTIIQCDSARIAYVNVVPDEYMIDLNDSLFTRGYMVEYYFSAFDADNYSTTCPRYAEEGQYFEFTCLPTGKSDILYVDDYHGRGTIAGLTEQYWNPTFAAVIPPENQPDRYDVNSPSSCIGNGLGGRAKLNQIKRNEGMQSGYSVIIWDCGNLNSCLITDGTEQSSRGDDCTLLINWLDQSENDVGLFVCGDEIAKELISFSSTQSMELLSTWCGVNLIESSYFDLTGGRQAGGIVNPLCTTNAAWPGGSGKQFYVFGGCPIVNTFDVLDATANGAVALLYPDFEGDSYAAGIKAITTNAAGYDARTMWFGFSWMFMRGVDGGASPLIRYDIFNDIYLWFNGIPNTDITEDDVPAAYRLAQNFPNPFNPTTTIFFDLKAKGHVSIKIYNVAGQLVRTLVDEVMDAGSYSKDWKGTNNIGADVASGIYFYRMETEGFSATRKMVLLR